MKFEVNNIQKSAHDMMRTIGYKPAYFQNEGEISIVRQIGKNDYPRFHLYIKEGKSNILVFQLHLDQKKPSYGGSHAHSGEYEGELVEREAERIKALLQ